MPASAVEHQDGVLVFGQGGREPGEKGVHRRGRDLRQDEGEAITGRWPDSREQVGPGVALVAQPGRPLAAGEPAMAEAPLLAETGLIHEPQRQALAGMLSPHVVEGGLQPPCMGFILSSAFLFLLRCCCWRTDRDWPRCFLCGTRPHHLVSGRPAEGA